MALEELLLLTAIYCADIDLLTGHITR